MSESDRDRECAIIWKLVRSHGWSNEVDVEKLVRDAAVSDKARGREIARNELPKHSFIRYHQGRDEIWLDPPPGQDLVDFLTQRCGYSELQLKATLSSYL